MHPSNLLPGASRRLARALPFRPSYLRLDRPTLAFTFDDFPLSAAENAAPMLEAYGMRGTFYFADGLAGRLENGQRIAGAPTARALSRRGHDIGGHTQSHLNVQSVSAADLQIDIAANDAAIAAASGSAPTSFAYPFGVVSLRSKAVLARRYSALRGISAGINRGWIDLAHLHAQELYDATPRQSIATLLDDLQNRGGWLIFYTHDVCEHPSSIGCSPAHFGAVLAMVAERGLRVETVAATLARLGGGR